MTAPPRGRQADGGFTLVELLIAIVLSGIIAGVTVAALATSMNVASSTSAEVADSTDASLITAFLYRDAQAAGTTNPTTAVTDLAYGVATSSSTDAAATAAAWGGCAQYGAMVARFSWIDRNLGGVAGQAVTVTYALDSSSQLVRRICRAGISSDVVLGHGVTAAAAQCQPDPACGLLATAVALTVSGSGARAPYTYTLTASLRVDGQSRPTANTSSTVALVALGTGAKRPCPVLTLDGAPRVRVSGDVFVDSGCGAGPIAGGFGSAQVTGSITAIDGVSDPFLTVPLPAAACADGLGPNPSPVGGAGKAGTPTIYPQPVDISGPVRFLPGVHVFCAGLTLGVGAAVSGTDVFLLVAGGSLTIDHRADVRLDAARTGPYANLLAWVATAQQVQIAAGERAGRLGGYVYAPTSSVVVTGDGATNIGGIVAQDVTFRGDPATRLGLPLPDLLIAPSALSAGQQSAPFAPVAFTAAGGSNPVAWTVNGLPDGLTLAPDSGLLSGVPKQAGDFALTVTAFDATGASASARLVLTIAPPLAIDTSTMLANGVIGEAYPATAFATTGGTRPYTWTATGLPDGLALSTDGVLTGTPKKAGSFTIVVTLRDATGSATSATFALSVTPGLAVTTSSLPAGQVKTPYAKVQLAASGATPPLTWSATGLPSGLTVDAGGLISGTPGTPGTYSVVVSVTDAAKRSARATLTLVVSAAAGVTNLPTGEVGAAYPTTSLTAPAGTAPLSWSASGLPAGLTLDPASGAISGKPTAAGTSTVEITVVDASGAITMAPYSITIVPMLTITGPTALPPGQVGVAYTSTAIATTGGISPFNWSASGLPSGVTVDPATGVISGQPKSAGAFTVVVSVADSALGLAQRSYTVMVATQLGITTTSLPAGTVGSAYSTTVTAGGGTVPYSWTSSGLPAGLTMSTGGVISGKPTAAGTSSVVVSVADAAGGTAAATFGLVVAASPASCPTNPVGWRGEYFANTSLSGTAGLCRDDAAVNFDWTSGSPGAPIPSDNFSVRWTRTQDFAAGTYTFTLGSDDGSRLFVDGKNVLDRWVDQTYPASLPTVTLGLTSGSHAIVMEYYERTGPARATLSWFAKTLPTNCPKKPTMWIGEYYSNINFSGEPTMCRAEASVDYDWGTGAPATGLPMDNFAVRWTNTQNFKAGTLYTFTLATNDGGRLYIDGALVLDRWFDQTYPATPPSVTRTLTAGPHLVTVEFYDHTGAARIQLTESPDPNS